MGRVRVRVRVYIHKYFIGPLIRTDLELGASGAENHDVVVAYKLEFRVGFNSFIMKLAV